MVRSSLRGVLVLAALLFLTSAGGTAQARSGTLTITPDFSYLGAQPIDEGPTDDARFVVANTTTTDQQITTVGISGENAGDFPLYVDPCVGTTLAPGAKCKV